jgi:hypothetical protein
MNLTNLVNGLYQKAATKAGTTTLGREVLSVIDPTVKYARWVIEGPTSTDTYLFFNRAVTAEEMIAAGFPLQTGKEDIYGVRNSVSHQGDGKPVFGRMTVFDGNSSLYHNGGEPYTLKDLSFLAFVKLYDEIDGTDLLKLTGRVALARQRWGQVGSTQYNKVTDFAPNQEQRQIPRFGEQLTLEPKLAHARVKVPDRQYLG